MTLAEMMKKAQERSSTVEFNGNKYLMDLKTQQDFKKISGKAYVRIGTGVSVDYLTVDALDEDDNCYGLKLEAIAFVKVSDAMHRDEFPVYAVVRGYEPQQCGMAKMLIRK